jgi:hypothetical protein
MHPLLTGLKHILLSVSEQEGRHYREKLCKVLLTHSRLANPTDFFLCHFVVPQSVNMAHFPDLTRSSEIRQRRNPLKVQGEGLILPDRSPWQRSCTTVMWGIQGSAPLRE